jgi:hypothetical protein
VDRPQRPTAEPRDYGCGFVALFAGLVWVWIVAGTTWVLTREGVSVGLLFSVGVSLLFWYWVGMGAWRRTIWGRRQQPPRSRRVDDR